MYPDLTKPIRDVIINATSVTTQLPTYLGAPTVFTRRPVAADAPYPMIVVSSDISDNEEDGVNDLRPAIVRDIAIYHSNERAEFYRIANSIARDVRSLFHRQRTLVPPVGWGLTDVRARGPLAIGSVGDKIEGLIVSVTIRVSALR